MDDCSVDEALERAESEGYSLGYSAGLRRAAAEADNEVKRLKQGILGGWDDQVAVHELELISKRILAVIAPEPEEAGK